MRLASYNILDGGEGRADPIAEVLLAQRADVIAVIESDNAEVLLRLSARLRMDFVVAQGQKHSVALFSRWQIGDTINHAMLLPSTPDGSKSEGVPAGCFLQADVVTPAGESIAIGVVHLHPRAYESDEQVRVRQLDRVLAAFEEHRRSGRAHVLCGDFNANAPCQQIDVQRCKPATWRAFDENGGCIPRRAIQRLLDAGYVDSLQQADPAGAVNLGSFTTQHPGQRVDYVFAFNSRVRAAWIEHDRLATYASDHYPVGAEIEWP